MFSAVEDNPAFTEAEREVGDLFGDANYPSPIKSRIELPFLETALQ